MTIATEINRLQIAKNNIKSAIEAKGVTVGTDLKLDTYPSKIAEIITGGGSPCGGAEWSEEHWLGILNNITVDEYVRPTDWLILPSLSDTDQKFVGLHAVWEDSNFLSLSATGAYTVDWGDGGVIENYNSGVQAYHIYDYNSIDINTLCSRGYKQVIVVVTPQSGVLTNINLNRKHNQSGLQGYASGWLDIRIAGSLSSLNISSSSTLVSHSNLEIAELRGNNTITVFDYLFNTCYKLQYLTTFNTSKGTSFSYMFSTCYSLQTIPLLDTASGTNFSNMFYNCYSLQTIPLLNTALGTSFSYMFSSCYSLQTIPLLDTASGTNFSNMFYNCYSLQTISLLNTASGTNFSNMFYNCYSLQTIPLLNTVLGTSFNSMFYYCYSLQTISLLNTASGTSFSNMFYNCYSLQTIPLLDTASGTNFNNMFYNCYSLQTIPLLDTASGTNFSNMFQNCYSLQTIPLLNTASGTSFSNMFQNCYSLQTIPLLDTASGTNFSNMFYNCYSLQTIPLLNTASGTNFSGMFYYCFSLQTIPLLNTASGTNFSNMFHYCISLQTIPLMDTASGTNFSNMFYACSSLQTIPPLNLFSNVSTSLSGIFINCSSLIKGRTNNTYLTISYIGCKLSKTAIVDIFKGLSGGITNTSAAIDSTQTIITVNDASLLVEGGYAYIWDATTLNPTGDTTHEIVLINSIVGNQLTVTRAQLGTTAKTHILGRKIGTYKASQTITITNNWGTTMLSASDRAIATARGWTIVG